MSYTSKSTITTMAASIALLVAYALHAFGKNGPGPEGPETVKSWALTMLVFIGIAVVALIVTQIVFHFALAVGIAATEAQGDSARVERIMSSSMTEDEMGGLIDLRATRVGYVCAGLGFVGTLAALAFGGSVVLALHILLGSFAAGSLASGAVTVYAHERGIRHG